jgi:hypothetical protein
MVSVDSLGQLSCPTVNKTQKLFLIEHPMTSNSHSRLPDQFLGGSVTSSDSQSPAHQQWPWRGFAFCSDLGTLGYLMNKPKLGFVGWTLALPYYLYALFQQPKGEQRNRELIYQATANGIFPFAAAKAGVITGGFIYQRFITQFIKKYPTSILKRFTQPISKIAGGFIALLTLTPMVGDPLSHWMIQKFQTHLKEGRIG